MNVTPKRILTFVSILSMAFFFSAAKKVSPVNSECPFSGKAVKAEKVLTFNVCICFYTTSRIERKMLVSKISDVI